MMDCEQFQSYLSEYLDGELPPGMSRDMQRHSASCSSCAGRELNVRHVLSLLRDLSRVKTSVSFEENLRNRIYDEMYGGGYSFSAASYRRFINVKSLAGVGIAAALVAAISVFQAGDSNGGGTVMRSSTVQPMKMNRLGSPAADKAEAFDARSAGAAKSSGDSTRERARERDDKYIETVKYTNQ